MKAAGMNRRPSCFCVNRRLIAEAADFLGRFLLWGSGHWSNGSERYKAAFRLLLAEDVLAIQLLHLSILGFLLGLQLLVACAGLLLASILRHADGIEVLLAAAVHVVFVQDQLVIRI